MHPIERLRYVARASGVGHDLLARETAAALASFASEPTGLVTAARRIVSRQPTSGPIWWLAAKMLSALNPREEAWEAIQTLEADPTPSELLYGIEEDLTVTVLGWSEPIGAVLAKRGDLRALVVDIHGEGHGLVKRLLYSENDAVEVSPAGLGAAVAKSDLVLLEASAVGPDDFLGITGSRAACATARAAGVPVWLVTGQGRLLPEQMWAGLLSYVDEDEPWNAPDEVTPLGLVDKVVGHFGIVPPSELAAYVDCPVVPELLKQL